MSASCRARAPLLRLSRAPPPPAALWWRAAPPPLLPLLSARAGGRRWKSSESESESESSSDANLTGPRGRGLAAETVMCGWRKGIPAPVAEVEAEVEEAEAEEAEAEAEVEEVEESQTAAIKRTVDPWHPEFGFVFDVDGVLLHKSKPIDGATETLKYLQEHKIPFILLTNGGGKTEEDRVKELSEKLGVELDTSNFVQSHTPYKLLARDSSTKVGGLEYTDLPVYLKTKVTFSKFSKSTVLVLGSDASAARRIAQGYGFKSVVTPGDILTACPELFPFDPLPEFYSKQEILPLPKPIYDPNKPEVPVTDCLKIDAILVFNDPRDWAVDIQLIMDLMLSHRGILGTYSRKNNPRANYKRKKPPPPPRWQEDGQPALVYSNCDLLWSTGYHLPRFGQGAFRNAVRAQFAALSPDGKYEMVDFTFGKPHQPAYAYAQWVLIRRFLALWKGLQSKELQLDEKEDGGQQQGGGGEAAAAAAEGSDEDVAREEEEEAAEESSSSPSGEKGRSDNLNLLRRVWMVGDNPRSDIRGANLWRKTMETEIKKQKTGEARRGLRPKWQSCLVRTGVWDEASSPRLPRDDRPDVVKDDVRAVVEHVLGLEKWPGKLGGS